MASVWFGILGPVVETRSLLDATRALDQEVSARTGNSEDTAALRSEEARLRVAIDGLVQDSRDMESARVQLETRLESVGANLIGFEASNGRFEMPQVVDAILEYRVPGDALEPSIQSLLDGPPLLTIRSLEVRRATSDETDTEALVVGVRIGVLVGSGGVE